MTLTYSNVDPKEFEALFISGFGQLLGDLDALDTWKWNTTFAPIDVAIVASSLPPSPDNAIVLASYSLSDDPTNSDSEMALQVTTRAAGQDPRATGRLTGAVYDQLHGLTNVVLPGGVYVVQCYRQSWTSTGQDENNRWREVSNFYTTVHRPSKYRV